MVGLLGTIGAINNTSPVAVQRCYKQWVAALLSDEPWTYYIESGPTNGFGPGLGGYVPPTTSDISVDFEKWYGELLGLIPTFRQALGASMGFDLTGQ
jgi:hypothetical protein